MEVLQSQQNLIQVEQTLSKNAYFSRSSLPGFADAVIYKLLQQNKKYPDKKIYPNFYHWYIIMRQFADSAFEGWIIEKRYVEDQSEKCLILIAQIFDKQSRKVLKQYNRKKSFDTMHTNQKSLNSLKDSAKIQPIDQNFVSNIPQKAQYSMIVQLQTVQNIQELFTKIYKLKYKFYQKRIKIKQLKVNKKQKWISLRFICQENDFEGINKQIQSWNDVKHMVSKQQKQNKQRQNKKKLPRAVSIR